MRVAVEPALGREGGLVEVAALLAALAGLHEHDRALETLAVRAGEAHGGGAGAAWRAAAAVPAHATVVGTVQPSATATGVVQTEGLRRLLGTRTLPPFLLADGEEKVSSHSDAVITFKFFIGNQFHC